MGLAHVSCASLSHCYRLGVKQKEQVQPVLIKFNEHRVKSEVWMKKSKLKGSGVIISEFLTKQRQEVYMKARKHFGVKNVWTLDESIYIKPPGCTREKIFSEILLNMLIDKFPMANMSSSPVTAFKRNDVPVINITSKPAMHNSSSSGHQNEAGRRKPTGTPLRDDDGRKSRRIRLRK